MAEVMPLKENVLAPKPQVRAMDDIPSSRQEFFDVAMEAAAEQFPVTNEQVTLELSGLSYDDKPIRRRDERKAVLGGRTMARNLRGTFTLKDTQTGEVLGESKKTVAKVPYLTDRGTFIYRGNDYSVSNQLSLRPGVYTRRTQSGNVEAPIHTEGGQGLSISLDPQTSEFRVKIQQSNLKAYPMLRALGYTDDDLREMWGEELLEANRAKADPRALSRIAGKITGDTSTENLAERLKTHLSEGYIDPGITRKTTGIETDHITPELIGRITQKLIHVSSGQERPSLRDALYAQRVRTPSIQLRDQIGRSKGELARQLWKLGDKRNLSPLPTGVLNDAVKSMFFKTGLAEPLEEINVLEAWDKQFRVTRGGKGGLSGHGVPDEARAVNPSQAGYLDPVRSPESEFIGIDLRATLGTYVDREGNLYSDLLNARTGEVEKVSSTELKDLTISFPDQQKMNYPFAIIDGQRQGFVAKDQVDYYIPNANEMFSGLSNLSPMIGGAHGGRLLMSAKFTAGAMPTESREAPLVQAAHPSGGSFEEKLAERAGAIRSPVGGKVTSVSKNRIKVQDREGEEHTFELYDEFPLNRKTMTTQASKVHSGQLVEPGDLLATSNFTDDEGVLALGTNLRTGFIASGNTFEDAMALSESAALRLKAQYMKPFEVELTDETTPGKHSFITHFPGRYSREQVETIGEDGLVKPGTKVQEGDPLILAYRTPENQPYYYQLRGSKKQANDESVTWEQPYEGVVTDAAQTSDGLRVFVKASAPAVQGDKLATREGAKGVATIIPDSEMPRDAHGRPLELLISPLAVVSRKNPALVAEALLGKAAKKRGEPYVVPSFPEGEEGFMQMAMRELKRNNLPAMEKMYEPETGREIGKVLTGDVYTYRLSQTAKGKARGRSLAEYTASGTPARGGQCYSEDTEILTRQGWKLVADAEPEDELATLNPDTDKLEYHCPAAIQHYRYEGRMRRIENQGIDLLVTPEHELYAQRRYQRREGARRVRDFHPWELIQAKDLPARSRMKKDCIWDGRVQDEFQVEQAECRYSAAPKHPIRENWQEVCRQYIDGGTQASIADTWDCAQTSVGELLRNCGVEMRKRGFGNHVLTGQPIEDLHPPQAEFTRNQNNFWSFNMNDFVAFMGIFLSEGSTWSDGRFYRVAIHQYKSVHPVTYAKIGRLLDRMGLNACETPDRFMINDASLYGYLSRFGKAPDKYIPRELLELGTCMLQRLFDWLIMGDGEERNGSSYRYYTVSKQLADDVQELALKLGMAANVRTKEDERYTDGVGYVVSITHRVLPHIDHDHMSWEDYDGYVHDVTVPPNHLIYVRRAGKGVWSKNSGGKRISKQPLNALLSHGALDVIKDAQIIRGAKNEEFWNALRLGYNFQMPKIPYVNRKLFQLLKSAGINVKEEGEQLHLMPLRDSEVEKWSKGEIQSSEMLDQKTLRPVPGGLFSVDLTGGPGGTSWSHISLPSAMPNPVMEKAIARLLGTPIKRVREVLSGEEQLNGKSGLQALSGALSKINVPQRIRSIESKMPSMSATKRDKALKGLKVLKMMDKHGVKPADLMIRKVPVIPPSARPISDIPKLDAPVVSDLNYLYKDLIDLKDEFLEAKGEVPEEVLARYRGRLYDGVKAIYGTGDPISRSSQEKKVKGVLRLVFGSGPKHSFLQSKVFGKPMDLSALTVITPNSDLDIDHVGLPESRAYDIYRPFVIRNLVQSGMKPTDAVRAVKDKSRRARTALETVMGERPVMVNRAPTLHKFGMMAMWPVITSGETLEVSPSIVKGFAADFDGDDHNNTVIMSIEVGSETWYNISRSSEFLFGRVKMPYSDTHVHGRDGREYFCVNLEDFPHGELLGEDESRKFYEVPEGVYAVSYDEKAGRVTEAKVVAWSEHQGNEVVTVELSSGRQIVSDDDPRAVYGIDPETLEFDRWRPSDAVGKWVPRVQTLPEMPQSCSGLPVESTGRLDEWFPLTRDNGYLIGCLVSNGWVDYHNGELAGHVCYSMSALPVQERYKSCASELFTGADDPTFTLTDNTQYGSSYGESKRISVSSIELARFIQPLIGRGVRGKHLPACFLGAGRDFRVGLLEGLMDNDGSISISRGKKRPQLMANYSSVSLRLVQEVQHLLRSLGLKSRITPSETPAGEDFWMLNIRTGGLQQLGLRLSSENKRRALDEAPPPKIESNVSVRYDLVPVSESLAAAFFEALDHKTHKTLYSKFSQLRRGKGGNLSRSMARRAVEVVDEIDHPHWERFCRVVEDEDVTWEKVEGYEETGIVETGYDLTVPGYETFMSADGVVLSNTMLIHPPVSPGAVKDAIKMLPSNTLRNPRRGEPMFTPLKEFLLGLNLASRAHRGKPRTYTSEDDAVQAFLGGNLKPDQTVLLPEPERG